MNKGKFSPFEVCQPLKDLVREKARETAEQLERKKTEVLFTLLGRHLGYEPTVTEALTSLKHRPQADGADLFLWDETPIVTFRPLDIPMPSKYDCDPYTVTHSIGYQSHVG